MATDVSRWKEMLDNSMSGNFLSENLIDIHLRLPVKSIVRFRCVCKSWCTLFDDPDFISMHLRQASANSNGRLLFKHLSSSEQEIYSLRSNIAFAEVSRLEVPVPSKTDYYQIVGSSNGLICLTESNFKGSYLSLNTFLWNPAIREFQTLPKYHINNFTSPLMVVGLGFAFHPVINDYKVVRIVYFMRNKTSEADVYSLRTGSWREVDANICCYIHSNVSRTFINGALHWLAGKKNEMDNTDNLILSFDMAKDVFKEMMLPDFGYDGLIRKCLADYKGSLSVLFYDAYHSNENCDVWVMEEYGVAKSWTKHFTIRHEIEIIIPFEFFDNGEAILQKKKSGGFISWDPDGIRFRDLGVSGPARLVEYMESLVSPRGGNGSAGQLLFYSTSASTTPGSTKEIDVGVKEGEVEGEDEASRRSSKGSV